MNWYFSNSFYTVNYTCIYIYIYTYIIHNWNPGLILSFEVLHKEGSVPE